MSKTPWSKWNLDFKIAVTSRWSRVSSGNFESHYMLKNNFLDNAEPFVPIYQDFVPDLT